MIGAESVTVPKAPTPAAEKPAQAQIDSSPKLGPYEAFEIASPEPNATVRSDTGELQVSLILAPAIVPVHRVQLLIDGHPVPGTVPGTQIALKAIVVGTHQLQAQILDELDVPVAYTDPVVFHMRRPVPASRLP